jgi:transcriptional regulator with XRE-family HTH domain
MRQKIFSTRLRILRKKAGMTQLQLAQSLNVSLSNIKSLETEHSFANTETIVSICDFFNVTADYMLGLSDDPHNTNLNPKEKIA